jgi:hypothetical protein
MYNTDMEERTNSGEYYNLYLESQKKIKKEEIISESLLQSLIRSINRIDLTLFLDMIDLTNTKANKEVIKLFNNKLNELFFTEGFMYDKIMRCGYETYGYSIYGKLLDKNVEVFIPNPKKLMIDNLKYAYYGKYAFGYEGKESCWNIICSSYNTEDIKKSIEEFKKCK